MDSSGERQILRAKDGICLEEKSHMYFIESGKQLDLILFIYLYIYLLIYLCQYNLLLDDKGASIKYVDESEARQVTFYS